MSGDQLAHIYVADFKIFAQIVTLSVTFNELHYHIVFE